MDTNYHSRCLHILALTSFSASKVSVSLFLCRPWNRGSQTPLSALQETSSPSPPPQAPSRSSSVSSPHPSHCGGLIACPHPCRLHRPDEGGFAADGALAATVAVKRGRSAHTLA